MAQSPFQIVAGPANVWIATYGTTFPVVNVAPGLGWTALGRTEGGVKVKHTQKVTMLMSDQDIAPIKAIRDEEGLEVSFSLAELTLENYRYVLNNATITTEVGPPAVKRVDLKQGYEVTSYALVVRGPSAYGNFYAQYQVPSVVQSDEPEVGYLRTDKAVLNCTFTALATLDGTPQFGRLIEQTA